MPTYVYKCQKCGHEFTLVMSVKEMETKKVKCPKCSSQRVAREITPFFAHTSKKS